MFEFQKRVVIEKEELDAKIVSLDLFLRSNIYDGLDDGEKFRMGKQYSLMEKYSKILAERINDF